MSDSAVADLRLRVHGLIEAAQDADHAGVREQVVAIRDAATRIGDAELIQFTTAAIVFYDVLHSEDSAQVKADCNLLVLAAEDLESPGARSMALTLRATHSITALDKVTQLTDAALAVALAEHDHVPAYERCFVWTTLSNVYISLDLWELADELNEQAGELAPECEEPEKQLAAVYCNRFLIRLAWVSALLEHGDHEQAFHHLRAGEEAARTFLTTIKATPDLWRWEAETTCTLMAFVLSCTEAVGGRDPDDDLARLVSHRQVLVGAQDSQVLPYLDAFTAFGLLSLGRVSRARDYASAPLLRSASAPARAFAAWVHARTLTCEMPHPATLAHRDYGALVCDLRWAARSGVLAAARARIEESRLVAEHALLAREVMRDALTGLANRRSFDLWLQSEPEVERPVALVLIDVDDFKQVNDLHGHAVGDEVLRRIGAAITASVRDDDVAIRLGGDEFAVILTAGDRSVAGGPGGMLDRVSAGRAQAISDAIATSPWRQLSPGLSVTVCVGHAVGQVGGVDRASAQVLYRRADEALYAAKRGRPGTPSDQTADLPLSSV